jgi:hypothetical protein
LPLFVLNFGFWAPSHQFVKHFFVIFKGIGVLGYFQVRRIVFHHLIPAAVITHRFLTLTSYSITALFTNCCASAGRINV